MKDPGYIPVAAPPPLPTVPGETIAVVRNPGAVLVMIKALSAGTGWAVVTAPQVPGPSLAVPGPL